MNSEDKRNVFTLFYDFVDTDTRVYDPHFRRGKRAATHPQYPNLLDGCAVEHGVTGDLWLPAKGLNLLDVLKEITDNKSGRAFNNEYGRLVKCLGSIEEADLEHLRPLLEFTEKYRAVISGSYALNFVEKMMEMTPRFKPDSICVYFLPRDASEAKCFPGTEISAEFYGRCGPTYGYIYANIAAIYTYQVPGIDLPVRFHVVANDSDTSKFSETNAWHNFNDLSGMPTYTALENALMLYKGEVYLNVENEEDVRSGTMRMYAEFIPGSEHINFVEKWEKRGYKFDETISRDGEPEGIVRPGFFFMEDGGSYVLDKERVYFFYGCTNIDAVVRNRIRGVCFLKCTGKLAVQGKVAPLEADTYPYDSPIKSFFSRMEIVNAEEGSVTEAHYDYDYEDVNWVPDIKGEPKTTLIADPDHIYPWRTGDEEFKNNLELFNYYFGSYRVDNDLEEYHNLEFKHASLDDTWRWKHPKYKLEGAYLFSDIQILAWGKQFLAKYENTPQYTRALLHILRSHQMPCKRLDVNDNENPIVKNFLAEHIYNHERDHTMPLADLITQRIRIPSGIISLLHIAIMKK
jgi:hypothetical protein